MLGRIVTNERVPHAQATHEHGALIVSRNPYPATRIRLLGADAIKAFRIAKQ